MATLTIELTSERYKQLHELAARYNVSTEDLARIAVEDMLTGPDEHFRAVADYVLTKKAELYRRLAASD